MCSRITDDVIDALQHCRLKAYFQLRGEQGAQSAYEKMVTEQRADLQLKAIEKIRRENSETEVTTDLSLSVVNLCKGSPIILDARLEDDRYAVHFDGLRRMDGPSALGDFRYEPVLFCPTRLLRASDRQRLAVRAFLLARVQGVLPRGGIVYLGRESARAGIRFGSALTAAGNLLKGGRAVAARRGLAEAGAK
jgi:predicted RecB family nuclease